MQHPTAGPHLTSWLLAYPDTYEIGLPNQGLQILYELLNERPDAFAERTYAPWIDLEAEMRAHGLPLFSVDTHRAAGEFDIIAFNLSAELVYTNVLNCIDLAGLAVRSAQRSDADPLIGAGGHCAFNPEPLADFVDFFVIGDGEEAVGEITDAVSAWKRSGKRAGTREGLLRELAGIEGTYVPAMYEVAFDGPALVEVTPKHPDVPPLVAKRTVADLAEWPYPRQQLVPVTEVVHDRLSVEVFRGCTRGCRFCQAGMITRPVRERPSSQVREMVTKGLERSGYDEVSLMSLSTADYSGIAELVRDTVSNGAPGAMDTIGEAGGSTAGGAAGANGSASAGANRISVSLPSLRVDAFTVDVAAQVSRARRTGLTFAPEAGSWRLRQIINKLITEEDLYGAVRSAYSQGWHRMKLYFLTGLPSEMDPDTEAIAHLADACARIGQEYTKRASVTVSLGALCPSRTRRSSGSGRTRHPSWLARCGWCVQRWAGTDGCSSSGTTRPLRLLRASPAGATGAWARPSSMSGARAARSRSGASASTWACGKRPWKRAASASTGTCTAIEANTRCCPGTTSVPGCIATFCGRTGRTPWLGTACLTADGPVLRLRGLY